MREEKILFASRNDLRLDCKNKELSLIEDCDFNYINDVKLMTKVAVVIFIDDDGKSKCLKNRFGRKTDFNYIDSEKILVSALNSDKYVDDILRSKSLTDDDIVELFKNKTSLN